MGKVYYSHLLSRYIYLTSRRKAAFKVLDTLWRLIECSDFDCYPESRQVALRASFEFFDDYHDKLCVACNNLYRLLKSFPHWC